MLLTRRPRIGHSEFFSGFTDTTEIGRGSLATVYRAREIGTNRLVALKLINVRTASVRAVESFEHESRALGALGAHPNIVTLLRQFEAPDGRPVLVLELCVGSVADRLLGGRGLPVPEVVALGIKIAGALETAHRGGILHRDVTPQNMLITEFGEPALSDFGVALLEATADPAAGLFDFTTLHAAPELLEGAPASAATDVYELASSLYQLIAGRPAFRPFEDESPASAALRILREPVRPLAGASVPGELSDLLVGAMSKQSAGRPPSAAEFAARLAAIEAGQYWPRTQFLVPARGRFDHPTVSRAPILHKATVPSVGTVSFEGTDEPPAQPQAGPSVDRPVGTEWSTATVSGRPMPVPPGPMPVPPMRPEPSRIIVERVVVERLEWIPAEPAASRQIITIDQTDGVDDGDGVDEFGGADLLDCLGGVVEQAHPSRRRPLPFTQYPIRPSAPADPAPNPSAVVFDLRSGPSAGPADTAGDRIGGAGPPEPASPVRIRSGAALLVAAPERLVSWQGVRRTVLAWPQIVGFEARFDDSTDGKGRLVAVTESGPVELPATRNPAVQLRRDQARLEAYRAAVSGAAVSGAAVSGAAVSGAAGSPSDRSQRAARQR